MAKYVVLYRGGAMKNTPEEQQASMAEWGAWFGSLGAAVADAGAPFMSSKMVKTDGVSASTNPEPITGYSVFEADSFDAAVEIDKGCPILKEAGSVEVFDPMPMPAM